MFQDFKKFLLQGNVVDMTVGIVIGVAFADLVKSFVNDILMPPIGLLIGRVDFTNLYFNLSRETYPTLAEAEAAGAPLIKYGLFINNLINYIIIALVIFLLIRWVVRQKDEQEQDE
ncbi:MAG: large conductance mechanosensitive channel protein MscL [Anaerolineales bacterium]|jgi:large conductance mechanosensitive channel